MKKTPWRAAGALFLGAITAACAGLVSRENGGGGKAASEEFGPAAIPSATFTPFLPTDQDPSAEAFPSGNPTPAVAQTAFWLAPSLPAAFRDAVLIPEGWRAAASPETADIQIKVGTDRPISIWIYALAAPFPTLPDGLYSWELRQAWSSNGAGLFSHRPLILDQNTLEVFSALWGMPTPGSVQVAAGEAILDAAWSDRPSWAIIPWENIEPRWKVLAVDGQSPMRTDFIPAAYPLSVPISCLGRMELCERASEEIIPPTNRDPAKMTTLVMTGVTALVRATASTMERLGVLYPAQDVGPLLREADLTHISNEIPFAQDCPPPDPSPGIYRFCSDPRYIDLLEYIGTDIVELTGNHVLDYKADALLYTIELYRQRGWRYYASGEDLAAARQPVLIEHNGNRLAFIGCNRPGYNGEWAAADSPGAAPCDFDYLQSEIRRLRSEGYLPIMTFQYFEFYHFEATVQQVQEFAIPAAAGAAIVSGSQAHHPQGIAFSDGAFLHYGLGNLFFDQFGFSEGTDVAFIDRHVFYRGRHLGTELISIRFVDVARPRFMTAEERSDFLSAAFTASGW
ncbi:MAG: CapA family protein [Anaerolineales bacterium]|nr:CapA family protein [Anaerolineales bacterium]